ncbi:MAG: hypothetical protein RRZ24_00020 [Clostridia bacterium]
MNIIVKRFVALCISCCMLLLPMSGCTAIRLFQFANEIMITPEPQPTITPVPLPIDNRDNIRFSEMTYTRPDIGAITEKIDTIMADIQAEKPVAGLMKAYEELQAMYNDAESQMSLAYLLYAFDVTNDTYQQEYTMLQSELTTLDLSMTDVSIALFESSDEAEQTARTEFGEDYVDTVYADETLNDEKIQDLLDAENELITEYDRMTASFTLMEGGRKWTLDEILGSDTLDYNSFTRLYTTYCKAFNVQAGNIYLELLGVRKQIAEKLGYGSYAAYGYDLFGRDYSITDVKALHAAIKKYIVPVYVNAEDVDTYELYSKRYDQETFLDSLTVAATKFSPALAESLGFMLRNDLYDFSVSAKKMVGSFTTYLPNYNAPFMFSQWTGSSSGVTTVIHELGHFTNYYHNAVAGWSAADCLDLAEVDSQALELLMMPYYELFYGDQAESAKKDRLLDCMYALVTGCMEDEFQQEVYANPSMSLEEINRLYQKLAKEYGLVELYGYTGEEWTLITHTFQTPMYYISYAVSMVPALELWEQSQIDPQIASETYFRISNRAPYAGFRQTLTDNGLSDVFSETTIARLAKRIQEQLMEP